MISVDRVRTRSHVVVGSGVAGLTAALGLGDTVILTKSTLGAGSTEWAQGGIAAAVGSDDRPPVHAADTVRVAGGLALADVAELVTAAAPDRIRWLVEMGARFDRTGDGSLSLGREAGHSRRRIVHADGDATGAELIRVLRDAVRSRPDIEVVEHALAVDLLRAGDRIAGVVTIDGDGGRTAWVARSVVVSTGGVGRLYARTTNPAEVTGDGLAMAIRAGVRVGDLEFVQFHPTALDSALDPMPLLTEALRGEGAHLVDEDGRRFMVGVHDDAELAPRDVVARQVWLQRRRGAVYLDARMIGPDLPTRFPTVWEIARRAGLDPRTDLLPVSPAQHFHMGGVAIDDLGRTSTPGLFACGEVASTGLHGANRLASNSLLEGLVFGARVAEAATDDPPPTDHGEIGVPPEALAVEFDRLDRPDPHVEELRSLMWDHVGVVRDEAGLRAAGTRIEELRPLLARHPVGRNLATAARLVAGAALERTESRGSHSRRDHPATSAVADHTVQRPEAERTTSLLAPSEPDPSART